MRLIIDDFIFSLVMYRARSVISPHDTHKIKWSRQNNFACTNTPLQTTRSPTRDRCSTILEGALQPAPDASQSPSILIPRLQSPAFGHLSAVRKSLREIGARHPGRSIYHESSVKKESDHQCTGVQGTLSISDLTNTNQQTIVFDREKAESLVYKLLDERDKRIEELNYKLLEDVKSEMHYRHELINNIVHLIGIERRRTQRLLCRSVVANKLLKQVQTKLSEQSAQIIELQARIKELELQVKEMRAQEPQIQHAIDVLTKSEDTIAVNANKIDTQIGSIYDYLQGLQCSLEGFISKQQQLNADNSRTNNTSTADELCTSLNIIRQQLSMLPLASLGTISSAETS